MEELNQTAEAQPSAANRSISISHDAVGNVLVTGDHNAVTVTLVVADQRLIARLIPPFVDTDEIQNPYRGLDVFYESDAPMFFGRERLIHRAWFLFQQLQRGPGPRILAVVGASGSGKSSLVRAGLLPALADNPMPGFESTKVLILRPGPTPLAQLREVLLKANRQTTLADSDFRQPLEGGQYQTLHKFLKDAFTEHRAKFLVIVDQFEELFTECTDGDARTAFLQNLAFAATQDDRLVSVLITLRSDFASAVSFPPAFANAVRESRLIVQAMSRDELNEAISRPARQLRRPWPVSLVENLVSQAEGRAGALPLLQFALRRLWPQHVANTLEDTGWSSRLIEDFLVQAADTLYEASSSDRIRGTSRQSIIRRAFVAMVQLGEGTEDTRRIARLSELVTESASADQIQEALTPFTLAEARLITASEQAGESTYELTHEALISSWDLLRGWLGNVADKAESERIRNDLRLRHRLFLASKEWKEGQGGLWRSPELDLLLTSVSRFSEDLTIWEKEFVEASEREQLDQRELERQRAEQDRRTQVKLRRFLTITIGLAAVLAVATALTGYFWIDAKGQRTAAKGREFDLRKQLGETARALSRDENRHLDALRVAWQGVAEAKQMPEDIPSEAFDGLTVAVSRFVRLRPLAGSWDQMIGVNSPAALLTTNELGASLWGFSNTGEFTRVDYKMPALMQSYGRTIRVSDVSADGKLIAVQIGNLDRSIATVADLSTGKTDVVLNYHGPDRNGVDFFKEGYSSQAITQTALSALSKSGAYYAATLPNSPTFYSRYLRFRSGEISKEIAVGTKDIGVWQRGAQNQALTLHTPMSYITQLAFSPMSETLVASDESGTLTVWKMLSVEPVLRIPGIGRARDAWPSRGAVGSPSGISSIAVSDDERRVFAAGEDGNLRIWAIGSGWADATLETILPVSQGLRNHHEGLFNFRACGKSKHVLTLDEGQVSLWRWDQFSADTMGMEAWSPVAGAHGPAKIYRSILDSGGASAGVACSSDGKWAATATKDLVRIFDASTGTLLNERRMSEFEIEEVSFIQDSGALRLAVRGESGIDVWSLYAPGVVDIRWGDPAYIQKALQESREQSFSKQNNQNDIVVAKLSGDRKSLLSGVMYGGRFVLHRADSTTVLVNMFAPESPYEDRSAALSEDGQRVAWNKDGVSVFDANSGALIRKLKQSGTAIALSPDGSRVAIGLSGGPQEIAGDTPAQRRDSIERGMQSTRRILIVEVSTATVLRELSGHKGQINALRFSSDGKTLYSAGLDNIVRVWDLAAEAPPIELKHPKPVWYLTLGCGTLVTSDGIVRIWDINKRRVTKELGQGASPALSEDCKRVVAAQDSQVVLWDLSTGRETARFTPHDEKRVLFTDFLDNNTILSLGGDGFLKSFPISKDVWLEYAGRLLSSYPTASP